MSKRKYPKKNINKDLIMFSEPQPRTMIRYLKPIPSSKLLKTFKLHANECDGDKRTELHSRFSELFS